MPWVFRGLHNGILTTGYPRRTDQYADRFAGSVDLLAPDATGDLAALCPTEAITRDAAGKVRLDRGRYILCGRCVQERPDVFGWNPGATDSARLSRAGLVVPEEDDETLAQLRADLAGRVRRLRRSVHLRHVDAGSDGADGWEVAALLNPVDDAHPLGIFFTANPRHADILLVTGAGARGMLAPLPRTLEAMPARSWCTLGDMPPDRQVKLTKAP